jgi:site-specific recombinase XerD
MRTVIKRGPLSADKDDISTYVAYLHNQNKKVATIRSHLSSISFQFKFHTGSSPSDSFRTAHLLKAYKKADTPQRVRQPVSATLLHRIVTHVKRNAETQYEATMLASLFTLMYHGLLRIGEVTGSPSNPQCHNLSPASLRIKRAKSKRVLYLSFRSFKHSTSDPKPMSIASKVSPCPVKAYAAFLRIRPDRTMTAFCYADSKPLTATYVRQSFNRILHSLGMRAADYNTHSFRIGRATDMYTQGFSDAQIAMAGRWKSRAFVTYIKPRIVRL